MLKSVFGVPVGVFCMKVAEIEVESVFGCTNTPIFLKIAQYRLKVYKVIKDLIYFCQKTRFFCDGFCGDFCMPNDFNDPLEPENDL